MSTDDGDIEDDGLSAFRSAWRSMPDEEPPSRGLAELMAAARVKADEMKQPTMWERFVALLRRPQVLALATIMILLGGALFVTQRKDRMQAAKEAAPMATGATPVEAPGAAQGSAASMELSAAPPSPEAAADEGRAGDMRDKKESPKADNASPPREEAEKSVVIGGASDAKVQPKHSVAKKTATANKPSMKGKASGENDDLFLDGNEGATATGTATHAGAGGGATPKDEAKAPDATAQDPSTPTVKQLHTQARTAAAANDCTKVKALAKQIARMDAAYYRANIATDKSLATCLN